MKSKLLMVGIAVCFLLGKSAYAQNVYYLPHFADGNFGVLYKTSFIFFNNSDASVTATLKLTRDNGAPLPATITGLGTGSQFSIPLSAGATKIYQTDGSSSFTGAATVTATGPIGVSAVFTVSDTAGNFLSESGVGASDLMTDFMIPVDSTAPALTGLALFNPGTSDASLTLTLFQTNATTPSGGTMTVTVPSGNHMAAFVGLNYQGQFFPTVQNFRGTMRVQSNTPIAALVLRQTQTSTTTTYTSLPVVPRSSTKSTLNLAHIANGNFGSISFKTSFLIFNISQSTANVTLALTKDNSDPMPVNIPGTGTNSSFTISLAPNASVFLQTDGLGTASTGAATITSNVPVGASSIFTVLTSQGQFQTEAGVGDSSALTSLTLPVDITGLSDTGVAFFNPGTSSVTVTLKLLDANDAVTGTTTRSLAAKAHLAAFVDQFFSVSNFRGSLAVTSTGGIASIVLRQYNSGANYTTLPTASGTATGTTPTPSVALLSQTFTGITPPITKNVTLPAGFLLSGTVSGAGTASSVIANGGGTSIYAGAVNPSTGHYVIVVPQGTYQLTAFYQPTGSSSTVTVTGSNLATVQVNADTTQDITLPSVSLFNVSGNVSGLSTLPSGTSPAIVFTATDNTMQGTFNLDASGNFQGVLPSGSYVATARSSIQFALLQTESLTLYNLGTLQVAGAAKTASYTIPTTATLTGTISGLGATGPIGTTVTATDTSATVPTQLVCCSFPAASSATPNILTSQYQMILTQGRSYSVGLSTTLFQGQTSVLGIVNLPVSSSPLSLPGSTTLNFTVPTMPSTSTISGRVTDSSGNGVAKVSIIATSQSISGTSNLQFSGFTTTDASGNYSFPVLNGTNYTLTYFPPPPTP